MANNEEEIKLTQTTINGVPLPQTPKPEVINESFDFFMIFFKNENKMPIAHIEE